MIALAFAMSTFAVGTTLAHKDAVGIVKERMQSMKAMGKATKALGESIKSGESLDPVLVKETAAILAEHGERIVELFPDTQSSRSDPVSEALPEIWSDWDRFKQLADELTEAAGALDAVAAVDVKRDAVMAAFKDVARNCKACHRDFRKD